VDLVQHELQEHRAQLHELKMQLGPDLQQLKIGLGELQTNVNMILTARGGAGGDRLPPLAAASNSIHATNISQDPVAAHTDGDTGTEAVWQRHWT